MLQADGSLDRARLRAHVFADPAERTALEAITHPAIRLLMQQQCEQAASPYAIAAIPLLTEVGGRQAYRGWTGYCWWMRPKRCSTRG